MARYFQDMWTIRISIPKYKQHLQINNKKKASHPIKGIKTENSHGGWTPECTLQVTGSVQRSHKLQWDSMWPISQRKIKQSEETEAASKSRMLAATLSKQRAWLGRRMCVRISAPTAERILRGKTTRRPRRCAGVELPDISCLIRLWWAWLLQGLLWSSRGP